MTERPFRYSGDELGALEGAQNYYGAIVQAFASSLGSTVVEVGAGTGNFARYLLKAAPGSDFVLIEPAENNFPTLEERFRWEPRVRLIRGYLDTAAGTVTADTVVAVNVLEHIEDDVQFLHHAWNILRPGGRLLLFVPAHQWLYGALDERFEHFRRYTKDSMRAVLTAQGFEEVLLRYSNLPGVLGWFLLGRVLRRRTIEARMVKLYDRYVVPPAHRLEQFVSPPCGQSILSVFRKPA